jgi:hypothetical protein
MRVNRTKPPRLNRQATRAFNHGLYDQKSLLSSNLENYGVAILLVLGPATRRLDVRRSPPVRFTRSTTPVGYLSVPREVRYLIFRKHRP